MPELKKHVSGDEKKLAVALFSPQIKDASIDTIKESLRVVMVKVGLRAQNWPNDLEKIILIQHIQENFGGNTVDEIRLAFDMAITGKLDIDSDSVNCYENFSCAYFSKIMIAYRAWSVEAIKTVPVIENNEQRIFTQAELDDSAREDAQRQYRLFLKGHDLKGVAINKPILEKDGFLKEDEGVMDFFKRWASAGKSDVYVKD